MDWRSIRIAFLNSFNPDSLSGTHAGSQILYDFRLILAPACALQFLHHVIASVAVGWHLSLSEGRATLPQSPYRLYGAAAPITAAERVGKALTTNRLRARSWAGTLERRS